ncbi:MAG TPA: exonuclease V subunit alpha, partial [Mycobacterium sp.]|nr:exonuclease V subunit alpha [Mycobacterium sp.]
PAAVLAAAIRHAPLEGAADPAAVLDSRIDPTGGQADRIGPLRWLPAIPARLQHDPRWGAYLARRATLVEELAAQIRDTAHGWSTATAPAWATPLLSENRALAAEIAVFRAALGVPATDTRLLGVPQYPARTRAVQTLLHTHATKAIGRRGADTRRWHALLDAINPHIRADSYWPQLAAHLTEAARSRPDLAQLVETAAAQAPLPDELPAAALWWRLAGELDTPNARLRRAGVADLVTGAPADDERLPPDAGALRGRYQHLDETVATLQTQIRANRFPSVLAAADEIRELRARADADLPYHTAALHVVAEWADAEQAYDDARAQVDWARGQLDSLAADPDADPLDIAAARADLQLSQMLLPTTSPAEQFLPKLHAAMAARAEAAGGADKIVSVADVDARLAELRAADDRALTRAKVRRRQLRIELGLAEAGAAAAFSDTTAYRRRLAANRLRARSRNRDINHDRDMGVDI